MPKVVIVIDISAVLVYRARTSTTGVVRDLNPDLGKLLKKLERKMGPDFKGCHIHLCYNSALHTQKDLDSTIKRLNDSSHFQRYFAGCKSIDGRQNDGSYRLTLKTLQKSLNDSSLTPKQVIVITHNPKLVANTELAKQLVNLYDYGQLNRDDLEKFKLERHRKMAKEKPLYLFSDYNTASLYVNAEVLRQSVKNPHMVNFIKQHSFKECTLITARQNPYYEVWKLLYDNGINAEPTNYDLVIRKQIRELIKKLFNTPKSAEDQRKETRLQIVGLNELLLIIKEEIEKVEKIERSNPLSVPNLMRNYERDGIKFCNDGPIYTTNYINGEATRFFKIDLIHSLVTQNPAKYRKHSLLVFTDVDPEEIYRAKSQTEEFAQLGVTLVAIEGHATASHDKRIFKDLEKLVEKAANSNYVSIMTGKNTPSLQISLPVMGKSTEPLPTADENNMNLSNLSNSTLTDRVSTMSTTPG